jgi:hypothetical protein
MSRRIISAIVAGSAILALGSGIVALAPAASASQVIQACQDVNINLPTGGSVILAASGDCLIVGWKGAVGGELVSDRDGIVCMLMFVTDGGVPSDVRSSTVSTTYHVTINDGPAGSPVPATCGGDASAIPAWVQAYGRASAEAGCADGWSPSWQEWAEPVTGGWVCTRSVPSVG